MLVRATIIFAAPTGERTMIRSGRKAVSSTIRVAAIIGLTLMLAVAGCSKREAVPNDNTTPAGSVQGLLELRADNSTDTAAYLRHVESTSLAEALVEDSAHRTATDTPIPDWQPPKVTKSETSTAEVRVVWKPSSRFEGWVKATTFVLEKIKGKWLIIDARDDSSSDEATSTP